MINNFRNYIDFLFYLRGFLAFILVPLILLFNILPFSNILLYSNVYLNNYRFPNLNEPFYYCSLYFFSITLFLIFFNLILKKINFKNNYNAFDNVKNINLLFIYIFAIIFILKLRILNNFDYLNSNNYLGDLLLDNLYTNFIIHFFLPNELVFIFFSLYFDRFIKNKFVNSFFIIYFALTLASTIIFRSRFLLLISLIMFIFFLFKFIKNKIYIVVLISFIIIIFFFYTFLPYDHFNNLIYPTNFFNYIIIIFDHLVWRLDTFHLVDLGYASGNLNVIDTNTYGRNYGMISIPDVNTGIEFPFFYDFIKIDNLFLSNSLIIIICSFIVSILYTILKIFSFPLGKFFFIAFLFKFSAHWTEMPIDLFYDFFFKLFIIYFIIMSYIFIERKILIIFK